MLEIRKEIIHKEWSEFFEGKSYAYKRALLKVVSESYYVTHCSFRKITIGTSVIFSDMHDDSKVLIDTSSFFQCISSTNAGSLEYASKGQIVQSKISYFQSFSKRHYGNSFYSDVTKDFTSKNFLLFSSVTNCGPDRSIQSTNNIGTIYLNGGNTRLYNSNISYNQGYEWVGFYMNSSSPITSTSYISVIENNQTFDVFMRFNSNTSSNVAYLTFSNIVNNVLDTYLLFTKYLCLNLSYCCMKSNQIAVNIYQIYNSSDYISIQNSCVEPRRDYFGNGTLLISNEIPDISIDLIDMNMNNIEYENICPSIPYKIVMNFNILLIAVFILI